MFKLCFFLLFIWPSLTVSVYDGSATDNKEKNREDLSPVNVHGYDASSTTYLPPVVIDPRRRPRERGEGRSAAGLPGMVISDGMARRNLRRNGRSSGMISYPIRRFQTIPDELPARRACLSDQFQCRNMKCITKNWVGDGDNDCGDNSDEQTGECRSDQFQCRNMKCIDKNYVGDGDNDCGDNSDEQTGECRSDKFQCRNMKCINKNWVDDGEDDCGDNSDEQTGECRSDKFQCRNMKCIDKNRVGDGDNDCGDNSDEQTGGECLSLQFQCRNMKCIPPSWVDDGEDDCGDKSDEQTGGECRSVQFQCRNMKCIDKNYVGDGHNDCGDNSDEQTDRRSVDSAVGGSSEHTSSTTGDSSSNVPLRIVSLHYRRTRNRPTTENAGDNSARIRATTENTGDSSARIRATTENTGDSSARIRATTENITPIRRSRFGWYSAVVRRTGDAVGSAATHRLDEYIRAPVPNPSVPLSCPEPNGLFPHPHECSKYLQCDHNSLFTRTCGPGTVFNPLNSVCDWPYNVNCQAVATPPVVVTTPPVVMTTTPVVVTTTPVFVTPPPRRATTWHGFDLRLNLDGRDGFDLRY